MTKRNWDSYFGAVRKQQWETAKQALKGVMAEEGDNPQIFLRLGDVYQKNGETGQAIACYHRCAGLLRERGFAQKAAALYRIILRLDPLDEEAIERSLEVLQEIEAARRPGPVKPPEGKATERPAESGPASARVPKIFSSLSREAFREVMAGLSRRSFEDGERVVEEGDSGDSLFFIESGGARVTAHLLGREVELAVLGEGDVFGEVAFLTGRPRTANVTALGPLQVCEIGRLAIESIIEKNPGVLSVLEEFYESRARDTVRKVKKR